VIAIDPGVNGGICYDMDGQVCCEPMPETECELVDRLRELRCAKNLIVAIEDVPKYCGRNLHESRVAVLFRNFGVCIGAALSHGLGIRFYRPQDWQSKVGIAGALKGLKYDSRKKMLRQRAQELYPHLEITAKTADAVLIYHAAKKEIPAQ